MSSGVLQLLMAVALALQAGCTSKRKATCDETVGLLAPTLSADQSGEAYVEGMELAKKMTATIEAACVADRWPQAAIECFADGKGSLASIVAGCEKHLGPEAAKALDDKMFAVQMDALRKNIEAPPAEAPFDATPTAPPAPAPE